MISNLIAYHIQKSLNWGLAAALSMLLLIGVLALYWLYDRMVGIDKLKALGEPCTPHRTNVPPRRIAASAPSCWPSWSCRSW